MALHKIKDFDPDYRDHFDQQDIQGFDLYSGDEKVGSVSNLLVDDDGNFRYLAINTGAWIFGKQVLLPIGRSRIDYNAKRVYVDGLSRRQVEDLPEYNENVDYDHEEQVRGVYRPMDATFGNTPINNLAHDRDTYDYSQDATLYDLNERDHQNLKLYQERLVANKTRQKTGEVAIGKRIETEQSRVSVPVEKERVVIERTAPTDAGTAVTPGDASFQEGEIARMEVYEEAADIRKEAFVREEVNVRKEVDRETVEAEEQIRREELDVDDTTGQSTVRGANQRPGDRI